MIIVFDLDYTLLNSNKFKIDLAKNLGISINKFNKDNKKYFFNNKYSVFKHIKILKSKKIFNEKVAGKKIKLLLKNIDKYLFPCSEKVIMQLKKRKYTLYLLSFGDKIFQKQKIYNLKIKKYFNKIIITDKRKGLYANYFNKKNEKIIFINDNAKESRIINKKNKKCRIILIDGPYCQNIKHNYKIVKSIKFLSSNI